MLALGLGVFPTRSFLDQRADVSDAERRLAVLREQNEALADQLERLSTPEEVERLAREEYNLVRPGEEAYSVLPAPLPALELPQVWPFGPLERATPTPSSLSSFHDRGRGGRGPGPSLRRPRRRRRHRPRRGAGRGLRVPRAQRRREDHAVRMLTTLLRPTEGTARVAGYDVVRQAGDVRRNIGVALQATAIDALMTGRELHPPPGGPPRHPEGGGPRPRRRAPRPGGAHGRGRPPGRPVLGRHAAGASTSRWPSCTSRPCCSSTSRPPASTPRAAWRCGRRSAGSTARAPPCSSRRSTSTRPTSWPAASPSSTTAGSCATARPPRSRPRSGRTRW